MTGRNAEYKIRTITLPDGVCGVTAKHPSGKYTIYINKNLPYCQQKKAVDHEIDHIHRGDFENRLPLTVVESYISDPTAGTNRELLSLFKIAPTEKTPRRFQRTRMTPDIYAEE